MEVVIYIAGALVTFVPVWLNCNSESIGPLERIWLSFGIAGFWPLVWMLFIPCAVMGMIEHLNKPKVLEG